jgi:hypothetical protein
MYDHGNWCLTAEKITRKTAMTRRYILWAIYIFDMTLICMISWIMAVFIEGGRTSVRLH